MTGLEVPNKSSETSVGIVRYVTGEGNPDRDVILTKEGRTYTLNRRLSDGRELSIYLTDGDKTADPENMPNSRLEINLTPGSESQFGFDSEEFGLTGRLSKYVLCLGLLTGDPTSQFTVMRANESGRINQFFQARYDVDTKEILKELRGE
jgi:hypothetical protein